MKNILDNHLLGNYNDEDFEFYKNFHHQEDAMPYVELLKENEVPYRLEGTDVLITEAIVGTPNFPRIVLKILPEDFKKVNGIIEQEILSNVDNFSEHYLNDYSDRELLKLLKKPDESTIEEIIISKELLKSRGIPIAANAIEEMKQDRLEELQKGKSGNLVWMISYMIAAVVGSIFFSPLGIIAGGGMGWYYWKDKSVDIDGNHFFTFDPSTRNFGYFLLIVTVVIVFVIMLLSIFYGINFISPVNLHEFEFR